MTTKSTRRKISRGVRKTYRERPEVREKAVHNAALGSLRAAELVALGKQAEKILLRNRELETQVEVLTSKLRTSMALHDHRARHLQQLEMEVQRYWELYQAALGPVEGREVSQ